MKYSGKNLKWSDKTGYDCKHQDIKDKFSKCWTPHAKIWKIMKKMIYKTRFLI